MRLILIIGAAAVAVAAALAAIGPPLISAARDSPPAEANLTAGADRYSENCASCHGAQLEGQADWQSPNADGTLPAPPHDESGHTWHHGDAMLLDYAKLGGAAALEAQGVTGFKSGMPGFGEVLSDHELRDILAYIKSTWPDDVREMQASRNGTG